MTRWKSNHAKHLVYVGVYGGRVDFGALPLSVQTAGMAANVGALSGSRADGDGTEACGSPGEVANVPSHGHRYHIFLTKRNKGLDEMLSDRRYGSGGLEQGKVTVHTALALGAASDE